MNDCYNVPYNTASLMWNQYLPDSTFTYSTTNVNGLITPLSYPVANEPQIQELITPLDEYPLDTSTYQGISPFVDDQAWSLQPEQICDPSSFNLHYQGNMLQPTGQFNQLQQPHPSLNVQTAPSSPDCLPLQVDTLNLDTTDLDDKGSSEELVGMGLYDSPADVQSTALLFGGISNTSRKGLKLEESFVPEERDDEEVNDNEDESDAEEEDEAEVVESPFDAAASRTIEYRSQSSPATWTFFPHGSQTLLRPDISQPSQLSSAYYPTSVPGHGWI